MSSPSPHTPARKPVRKPRAATALVRWIARFGVATTHDLALRFELPVARAQRLARELVGDGLLRETGTLAGEPPLLVATHAGLRAVGLSGLGVCRACPRAQGHLRAVASCAVWLERAHGERFEVWSERELRLREQARFGAPRGLARPYVHGPSGAHKRADLLLVPRSAACGLPLAVEVELSRKSDAQLHAICVAWQHCAQVAGVLYLAAPALVPALVAAVQRARASARIAVIALVPCDVPALRRKHLYRPQPLPRDLGLPGPRPATASGEAGWRCSFFHAPRARARVRGAGDADMPEALRWVGRFGIVPLDALALHLRIHASPLQALLASACNAGLLHCARILRDEGPLLWASARGLRAARLAGLRPCAVSYHSALVLSASARVAAALELEHGCHRVMGARELAPHWGVHRTPALLLAPPRGDCEGPIAVLVVRPGIASARLRELIDPWLRCEQVAATLLCSPCARVRRAALRIASASQRSARLAVRDMPPRPVTALATPRFPVPLVPGAQPPPSKRPAERRD